MTELIIEEIKKNEEEIDQRQKEIEIRELLILEPLLGLIDLIHSMKLE